MIARRRLHRATFIAAGLYNLGWGALSVADPQWLFRFAGMPLLNHPQVFACLGMVIGLYGLLYFEVARVPERGWLVAAVGLLGKLLGPIGLLGLIWSGAWPPATVILGVTNDIVWWIPFGLYLYDAWPHFWHEVRTRKTDETGESHQGGIVVMPGQKVLKVSDQHYELPCSVCGQTAVIIRKGTREDWDDKDKTEYLRYRGIAHEPLPGLDAKHDDRIFQWLEKSDLASIHAYFKEIDVRMEDGMDAYCPECDAIYCWTHFDACQEFEDGWFYDCTTGTCPQGHRRVLDD